MVEDHQGEPSHRDVTAAIDELAARDRLIGLRAGYANRTAGAAVGSRSAQRQIDALQRSTTWKVGRIALAPAVFVRRLIRRDATR